MTQEPSDSPGELVPANSSIVQVKIGRREYSMVRHTRCGVCMHPGRFAIEEKMMLNFGYPAIVRFVSSHDVTQDDGSTEEWPELSRMQLINHRNAGHIPLNAEMVQELARRRAEQQGIDLENHSGQFIDHVVANEIILQQGLESLIKGEIKPDVKDLQAAIKLRAELEADNHKNENIEQYQDLAVEIFRTLQAELDEPTFRAIMTKISTNPTFKAIQQRRTIEG